MDPSQIKNHYSGVVQMNGRRLIFPNLNSKALLTTDFKSVVQTLLTLVSVKRQESNSNNSLPGQKIVCDPTCEGNQ